MKRINYILLSIPLAAFYFIAAEQSIYAEIETKTKLEQLKTAEEEATQQAIQASSEAKKAAQLAKEAADVAAKKAKQAQELAQQAEESAYQAYLAHLNRKRSARASEIHPVPSPPQVDFPTQNAIDTFIAAKWPSKTQTELCSDYTFIRRVFLDVVGFIPSATEVDQFRRDDSPQKRSQLIDSLLERHEDYAVHWSQYWEDALCSNGSHQGGVGTRANFRQYIINSFKENKPYDVFLSQLIDPSVPKYRGGYVRSETHQDSLLTAANVGQVFMGTKMKCASCHDHFLNLEWTQKRFFGFASYFSPRDLQIIRCEVKHDAFVSPQFVFANGDPREEKLDTLEKRLAKVTDYIIDPLNPRFASSFVNRLWKRFVGLGLVEPVDDFREDNPPSHPDLLKWLAYEFSSHDYDIKHMIRLILNSRTYQLKYNAQLADTYTGEFDSERLFRSPGLRRLTCEQMLDSVSVALRDKRKRQTFDNQHTGLTLALGKPSTRNEVMTQRQEDVAVIQMLEFMNGKDFYERVYTSKQPSLLAGKKNPERAVELAFVSVLNRPPSPEEKTVSLDFIKEQSTKEDWADMLWGLLVTPEFQYIH